MTNANSKFKALNFKHILNLRFLFLDLPVPTRGCEIAKRFRFPGRRVGFRISDLGFRISKTRLLSSFIFCLILFLPWKTSALTLSPPILDLTASPGEIVTSSIVLENETNLSLSISGYVEAFAPDAHSGEAEFFPSNEGLVSWIELGEREFVLAPGEVKKVFFKINIPKDIRPGSYYAAVFWGTPPPLGVSSGARVASRLGALIFLRINGYVSENLELKDFGVKKIYTALPAIFSVRVKNSGDVHLIPKGEILIKTLTGKQVAVIPWNESNFRVLPGGERVIEAKWGRGNFFEEVKVGGTGYYRASIHISYGSPIKETGDFISFWVLPIKSLGIAISTLILLAFFARACLKTYNKWIIRRHLGS